LSDKVHVFAYTIYASKYNLAEKLKFSRSLIIFLQTFAIVHLLYNHVLAT